jgi:opacity protein-like surface antigen
MKKILLSFAALAGSMAADNHCTKPYAFHLGAQGGYLSQFSSYDRAFVNGNKDTSKISGENAIGGLFVGGHYVMGDFVLGLDIFANYADCKAEQKTNPDNTLNLISSLKIKHTFGAAFQFGYMFQGTVPYLKIGVAQTKWELTTSNTSLGMNNKKKSSSNKTGLLLGAGADMFLTKEFKLGFEYNHIRYDGFSHKNSLGEKFGVKPRTNTFMLRAAWVI